MLRLHKNRNSAKSGDRIDFKFSNFRALQLSTPSELLLDAGLKQSNKQDTSLLDLKGPPLLPALPSTVLRKAEAVAPTLQTSTSKMPAWLDVALCSSKTSTLQNDSIGKVSHLRDLQLMSISLARFRIYKQKAKACRHRRKIKRGHWKD